jgi:hypothetical protein
MAAKRTGDIKKTAARWARLAVDYYRDPKLIAVGPIGEVAFIRLLALAREVVENATIDGAIPALLAARELRDIGDLYTSIHPDKTLDDLLAVLETEGLIQIDGRHVIVSGYQGWQTTRSEIDAMREENRARVAAFRARKKNQPDHDPDDQDDTDDTDTGAASPNTIPGGEDNMGVYDNGVEAFTDLRDEGQIKAGNKKIGKHGLNPAQVADAETIIEHLAAKRKEILGGNFKITATWWSDVKKILNGSGDTPGFTAAQACDLIDFALADKFWHAHCQTPAGLAKHGGKLYNSDEFVAWSKTNGRPEANRPRNTLIRDKGTPTFRGKLAADNTSTDWSKISGDL